MQSIVRYAFVRCYTGAAESVDKNLDESLQLTAAHMAQMQAWLTAELPNEGCGLLAGNGRQVRQVLALPNAERSPQRFRAEAKAQVAAMLELDRNGWELLGVFHSHPGMPAQPSETDQLQAYYPEAVSIIFGQPANGGGWDARAFRLQAGSSRPVQLQLTSDAVAGA